MPNATKCIIVIWANFYLLDTIEHFISAMCCEEQNKWLSVGAICTSKSTVLDCIDVEELAFSYMSISQCLFVVRP